MAEIKLQPYKLDTALTGYMPVPRELLAMELPSTAILIYAALLDRATLSQKNNYAELGWVYVIYPIEKLAQALSISDTAVKRHLRELEDRGLIHRQRQKGNGPNRIYLNLTTGSVKGTNCPGKDAKRGTSTGRKVPANNQNKQHNQSNYYQHGEDESL